MFRHPDRFSIPPHGDWGVWGLGGVLVLVLIAQSPAGGSTARLLLEEEREACDRARLAGREFLTFPQQGAFSLSVCELIRRPGRSLGFL